MANWLNIVAADFDHTILEFFHNLAVNYGNILTPFAKFLAIIGDLPLLLIGWLGFALFFILKDKKCGMFMCGSVIIGAIFVTIILKNLVYRPRPYISSSLYQLWWEQFKMKVDWDTSFPSGHACAALSGTLAFFVWSKNKKVSWLVFLYPLIMGCSRIYLCLHYPSDVIAGYLVAILAVITCVPFVKLFYYFFKKYPDNFFSAYCLTGKTKKQRENELANSD